MFSPLYVSVLTSLLWLAPVLGNKKQWLMTKELEKVKTNRQVLLPLQIERRARDLLPAFGMEYLDCMEMILKRDCNTFLKKKLLFWLEWTGDLNHGGKQLGILLCFQLYSRCVLFSIKFDVCLFSYLHFTARSSCTSGYCILFLNTIYLDFVNNFSLLICNCEFEKDWYFKVYMLLPKQSQTGWCLKQFQISTFRSLL